VRRSLEVERESAIKGRAAAAAVEARRAAQSAPGYRERSKLGTPELGSIFPAEVPAVPPTLSEKIVRAGAKLCGSFR
jgi:hypothetical protein